MKQTIVYLTEEQHEALRKKAFNERTSISDLVRTAIDALLLREKESDTYGK